MVTMTITKPSRHRQEDMPGLTEAEKERIQKVARIPRFKRSPELLCPDADDQLADERQVEQKATRSD